jgi:hypothetical protein
MSPFVNRRSDVRMDIASRRVRCTDWGIANNQRRWAFRYERSSRMTASEMAMEESIAYDGRHVYSDLRQPNPSFWTSCLTTLFNDSSDHAAGY